MFFCNFPCFRNDEKCNFSIQEELEKEAAIYIAGYVMHKTKKTFPEFVDHFPPIDQEQQFQINLKSFGKTIPSQVLVDNVVHMMGKIQLQSCF